MGHLQTPTEALPPGLCPGQQVSTGFQGLRQPLLSFYHLELCQKLFSLDFLQLTPTPQKRTSQEPIMPQVDKDLVGDLNT